MRFVSAGTGGGSGLYYVHADHLGTPQKMTDGNQALVWDAVSKPFGEAHSITGTASNNQRFPGQYADAETGFNYNYFRDYDPSTGRYVESDPIGVQGGHNSFLYARANPSQYIDVLGLLPECEILFQTYRRTIDFIVEDKWKHSTTSRNFYPVSGGIGPDYGPPNSGKAPFSPEIVFELWLVERWIAYQEKYYLITTYQQTRYLCKGTTTDECGQEEQWVKMVNDEKEIDRVKKYLGSGFDYGSRRIQFLGTFTLGF